MKLSCLLELTSAAVTANVDITSVKFDMSRNYAKKTETIHEGS